MERVAGEGAVAEAVGVPQRRLERVAGLRAVRDGLRSAALSDQPRVGDAPQAIVGDVDGAVRVELALEERVLVRPRTK